MNKKVLLLSLLLIVPAVAGCKKKAKTYDDYPDIEASIVEQTGAYSITWVSAAGSSYMMKDGGELVTKADSGTKVSFYLALDFNAKSTPEVTVNDAVVKADKNGYYTFTVKGNTTVKAEDSKVTGVTSYSNFYCLVNNSQDKNNDVRLVEDSSIEDLYYIKNVSLNANDTIKVFDSKTNANLTSYPIAGASANNGVFTVNTAGQYDVIVQSKNNVNSVYVTSSGSIIALGLDTSKYDYYIWTWGGVSGWFSTTDCGSYVKVEVPGTNTNFLIAAFEKGSTVETGAGSSWDQAGLKYKTLDLDRSSPLIYPDCSIAVEGE